MRRAKYITLFILIIPLVVLMIFDLPEKVKAGSEHNVSGWAWSENIGWISFNCINQGTCPTSNYGVNVDPLTGVFSGYAWSENIGWITFNELELTGCPTIPCQAKLDFATKQVSGWAKALTDGGGWDGWIKLRGTAQDGSPYGVLWNSSTQEMEGWAWSDMVIGWISFNCKNTGACATSNYKVIVTLDTTPPTTTIKIKRTATGEDLTAAGAWLRADTYTISFEDHDQAEGSGLNCENCSCEYSIYSCDVGGTNCNTPVVSLTSRICNFSFDILAGKTAPVYNLEGLGRYRIYSGVKDVAGNSAFEYRYINFDFTPPRTWIR